MVAANMHFCPCITYWEFDQQMTYFAARPSEGNKNWDVSNVLISCPYNNEYLGYAEAHILLNSFTYLP